jgi:hypothetical protein
MLRPLTGKPARFTLNCNYGRHVETSRMSVQHFLCMPFHDHLHSFLQDHSMYAVAQKKYVFIYDRDGVELHRLKSHLEPTRLEFLPFHWLLASIVRLLGCLLSTHSRIVGPNWLPQISRHLYRKDRRRTPHQARRMSYSRAESTLRRATSRPRERDCHALDAEHAQSGRALTGTSRAR